MIRDYMRPLSGSTTPFYFRGVTLSCDIWFDQFKKDKVEGAPLMSWCLFEEAFLWNFFPRELLEEKVPEFLMLNRNL